MPSSIRVGSRVSAAVGPFIEVQGGNKRRRRSRFKGTVIQSAPDRKWVVFWDDTSESSTHPTTVLRYEGPPVVENVSAVVQNPQPPEALVPTTAEATVEAAMAAATATVEAATVAAVGPATTSTEEEDTTTEQDPVDLEHEEVEEDHIDPELIVAEIMADDRDGSHLVRFNEYLAAKPRLTGDTVAIRYHGQQLTWTIRDDVTPEEVPESEDFNLIGVQGFNFNRSSVVTGPRKNITRINFLDLVIHLWPGDWRAQLKALNSRIDVDNEVKRRSSRGAGSRAKTIREISENEFWVWWGTFISAPTYGRKGNMWDRGDPEGEEPKVDFSPHITQNRFGEIRFYMAYVFADSSQRDDDPWWQFATGVAEFNKNRKATVLSSYLKVMDESMSAFRPQTQKTGNLPHLSFIKRKPEPLGTEFKVTADAATDIIIHLEIQRGRVPMRSMEFCDRLKVTSACTMRMANATQRNTGVGPKDLWIGDSWFTSIEAAVAVAGIGRYAGVLKTSHSGFPKKYLEETMTTWPAGSHLVLGSKVDGVDLLAIGYKYNKTKVTFFLCTKSADSHKSRCYTQHHKSSPDLN